MKTILGCVAILSMASACTRAPQSDDGAAPTSARAASPAIDATTRPSPPPQPQHRTDPNNADRDALLAEAVRIAAMGDHAAAAADGEAAQTASAAGKTPQRPLPGSNTIISGLGTLVHYVPARREDATNGKLRALLIEARDACARNSPVDYFATFNQTARFFYSQVSDARLLQVFRDQCDLHAIDAWISLAGRGELTIAENGSTHMGVKRTAICPAAMLTNGRCDSDRVVTVENGRVRWEWH